MVRRLGRSLFLGAAVTAIAGCGGDDTSGLLNEVDGGSEAASAIDGAVVIDGAVPGVDGAVPGVDSSVPGVDGAGGDGSTGEDGSAPDTSSADAADASAGDSSDATVADASDAGTSDASDATLTDAADAATLDASDAGPPTASLNATAIDFGAGNCGGVAAANQLLTVKNVGGGTLDVSAALGTTSFGISPPNAALGPAQSQVFTITTRAVPASATAGTPITDTLTLTTSDPVHGTIQLGVQVLPTGVTLALNPTAAPFGSTPLGVPQTLPVSLLDKGNVNATVTVTQPVDAEYSVTSGGSPATVVSVAAGSSAPLVVHFDPSTTNSTSTSAALSLPAGTPVCGTSVSSIPMSGQGAIGALSLSATTLSFGANGFASCGTPSGTQQLVIGNSGTSAFHVTSLALAGTSSVPYQLAGVTNGATVNPGAAGDLTLTITGPSIPGISAVPGNYADTLFVTTDIAGDSPHAVSLQLGAQGIILSYDTANIPFGFVPSDTTQQSGFNVINYGNAPAHVTLTAATDGGGTLFGVTPGGQFTLQGDPGGTSEQPSQASFTAPIDTNPHTGTITAAVAAGDVLCQPLPGAITLSGTAQNGGITTSTNSIAFGSGGLVPCGTTAGNQTLTVTNSGNATVSYYTSLGLGGSSPYGVSPVCTQAAPCLLAPGQANAATLTITPAQVPPTSATTTDLYADVLTVFSTAIGDTGSAVALHETAQGAILAFSTGAAQFGQIPTQSTQQQSIQILNSGNAATNVSLALAQSDATSEFSLSSASVNAVTSGPPGQFTVTFAPNGDTTAQTGTVTPSATGLCASLPAALQLGGQGTQALVSVPGTLNFNQGPNSNGGIGISCGAMAQPETLIVQNTGSQDANITSLVFGLGGASPFSAPATPIVVPAGGSAQIQITATTIPPSATPPGNFGDTLTVTTDALNDNPHDVTLQMNAAGVVLSMSSTNLQFSPTTNNSTSDVSFDLTNTGNVNASVVFSPPSQAVFTIPSPDGVSATGQPVTFTASFSPTGSGTTSYQATSQLSLAAGTPVCGTLPGPTIDLTGTGQDGVTITYAPHAINFGKVDCASAPPAARTITVFNASSADVSLAASIGTSWYTLGAVPSIVPAEVGGTRGSASFTVQPVMIPTSFATVTGAAAYADTITMVVGGVDYFVTLSENAQGAILSFNKVSVSVNRNGGTAAFNVRNSGNLAATIGLSDTNGASFSYLPTGSAIVMNANKSTPFQVTDVATTAQTDTVSITTSSVICQPLPAPATQSLPLTVNGK